MPNKSAMVRRYWEGMIFIRARQRQQSLAAGNMLVRLLVFGRRRDHSMLRASTAGLLMSLALSLIGKYQLVILAAEGDPQVTDHAARLDRALQIAFSHLGV